MDYISNVSNSSSYYYYSLEDVLKTYGSTEFLDTFNLFPFTLIAIVSFLLNCLCFVVFMQKDFDILPLYTYLRVYSFANIMLCLPNLLNFTYSTYRYFSWSWSYEAQFYYNLIYTPIISLSYFYGSVLDIIILLDRIATFDKRVKKIMNWPRTMCLVSFIACLIINIPSYIQFDVILVDVKLNATTDLTFWFGGSSQFALSQIGRGLILFNIAFRDGFTLLVEIYLNIHSIILLKTYLARRKRILSVRNENASVMKTVINAGANTMQTGNSTNQRKSSGFNLFRKKSDSSKSRSSVDMHASVMVISMCFLSMTEHAISFANFLYPFFFTNLTTFILYTASNFFGPFKRLVGFFLFYFLNKIFKNVCLRILRLKKDGF